MDHLTQALGGHIPIYMLIVIVTVIMAVAFVVGIKIQTITHFIWPKDVFSFILVMLAVADIFFVRNAGIVLFEEWFWLPAAVAYLLGFLFSSAGCYLFIATPMLAARRMPVGFIVPYWVGDEQFVQHQTNAALLKRLLLGIEHRVICNARLEANWELPVRHPYLPIPTLQVMIVDSMIDDDPEIIREGKRITFLRHTTKITVAPGSIKSKMDMIMIEDAHTNDVNENIKLSSELLRVKQSSYRQSMAAAADLLCYATVDATPGMQILRHIKEKETPKKPKKEGKEERK